MKKLCRSKRFLQSICCMAVLMLMSVMLSVSVFAASNVIINVDYTLSDKASDRYVFFNVKEKGPITVNFKVTDLGAKPGTVAFVIAAVDDSSGKYDLGTVVLDEKEVTSKKAIVERQEIVEAGLYVAAMLLVEPADGKVNVQLIIEGNGTAVDLTSGTEFDKPLVTELTLNYRETKKDLEQKLGYYDIYFSPYYDEFVMTATIDKTGVLIIYFMDDGIEKNFRYFEAVLYSDEKCTQEVGNIIMFTGERGATKEINIKKTGKYYIKFNVLRDYGSEEPVSFPVALMLIPGGTRTVKANTEYLAYQNYNTDPVYYKISVKEPSLLTINIDPEKNDIGSAKIALLDSKKKAITDERYISLYGDPIQHYFVLNKGTYYLKVDTGVGAYLFKYKLTAVSDKSGASKSKATNIKVGGSAVKGYCLVSDKTSKADWYKFSLTSSKTIKIDISSQMDGDMKVEVYDSKGYMIGSALLYDDSSSRTINLEKLAKGTYYIKVFKSESYSSGYYSIKVK